MTLHEDRDAAWEARIAGRPARTDSPRRAFDDGWAAALSRHPAPVPALDREAAERAVTEALAEACPYGDDHGDGGCECPTDRLTVILDAIMALAPAEVEAQPIETWANGVTRNVLRAAIPTPPPVTEALLETMVERYEGRRTDAWKDGYRRAFRDLEREGAVVAPPVTSEVGVTVEQVEVAAAAMQQTLNTRGLSMGLMAISAFRSVGIPVAGEGAK